MVNDQKYALVNEEFDALKAKNPNIPDAQLANVALDNVIARDIDTANFDITQTGLRQKGKGTTINVGQQKPEFQNIKQQTYYNQVIGGVTRAGLNTSYAWQKQGTPQMKGTFYLNKESNIINPKTKKSITDEQKDAIINYNIIVRDVYNKDGKPTARVSIPIPIGNLKDIGLEGVTEYEIELEESDNLEQSLTGLMGSLLEETGKSSVYDYVKDLKPIGGNQAPSPRPAAAPAGAAPAIKPAAKGKGVKGKSGKTWTKT
jgi:hypothetical protein